MADFPIAPIPKPSKHALELEEQRARPGAFGQWLEQNPFPELQELVTQYGSFEAIPSFAWDEHDKKIANWRWRYRLRHGGRR